MNAIIFAEGNGYGHAARDRVLSEHFDIPVITFGRGAEYCRNKNIKHMEIPSPYKIHADERKVRIAPGFTELMRLLRPTAIAAIKNNFTKADFVIVDGSPLGIGIAMLMGKKSVYISNDTASLVGVEGSLQKRFAGSILANLLKSSKTVIVPDFPPPLTISALNLNVKIPMNFCGPLFYRVPQIKHAKKYLVTGKLENELRPIIGKEAIFGTSFQDLIPYYEDAELVICHGGHSTIMEALSFGKPILSIVEDPYIERYNNGFMLERKNIGIMLQRSLLNRSSLLAAIEYSKTLDHQRLAAYKNIATNCNPIAFFEKIVAELTNIQYTHPTK